MKAHVDYYKDDACIIYTTKNEFVHISSEEMEILEYHARMYTPPPPLQAHEMGEFSFMRPYLKKKRARFQSHVKKLQEELIDLPNDYPLLKDEQELEYRLLFTEYYLEGYKSAIAELDRMLLFMSPVAESQPVKDFELAKQRAKEYPIPSLIKINKAGFANCIWHGERTGSLKYYKHSNTVYCFGACGKRYDAIDVAMQLYNCDFKTAVKKLSGKDNG